MRRTLLLAALLSGCATLPETTTLTGSVSTDRTEIAGPFADATVTIRDVEGQRVDQVTTGVQGEFTAVAPAGNHVFVVVEGEGSVPTSFAGTCGIEGPCEADEGQFWGFSSDEVEAWREIFAGCPGAESGSLVLGEARVQELIDPTSGENPTASGALAELWNPVTEEVIPACYLTDDGTAYDPDALVTGESAIFGIWGAEEGVWVLSMGLEIGPGAFTWDDRYIYVVNDGVVPRFPAWVHFPI